METGVGEPSDPASSDGIASLSPKTSGKQMNRNKHNTHKQKQPSESLENMFRRIFSPFYEDILSLRSQVTMLQQELHLSRQLHAQEMHEMTTSVTSHIYGLDTTLQKLVQDVARLNARVHKLHTVDSVVLPPRIQFVDEASE